MIHRALRLLRSYHDLKQKDLADRLGISQSHLSEIETGTKPVSYGLLQSYAEIFDVPVSSITYFAEPHRNGTRAGIQYFLTEKALRFMEWIDQIANHAPPPTPKRKPKRARSKSAV